MGKIIALWGSPHSGKTTLAVKLACAIYDNYKSVVITLLCDNLVPSLPIVFPNAKKNELYSLGQVLAQPEIRQEHIIKNLITIRERQNLGFLGYMDGENKLTYPGYNIEKALTFIEELKKLADYIIVDCTSHLSDLLSDIIMQKADIVLRLSTPNLQSVCYQNSQFSMYLDATYHFDKHIKGINMIESDIYMPEEEMKSYIGELAFVLPYDRTIKEEYYQGKLLQSQKSTYTEKVKLIAEKVV